MDFGHDERTHDLCARLQSLMDSHIYPAEPAYHEQAEKAAQEGDPWRRPAVVAELKAAARERGLWNLFLPGHSGGAGARGAELRRARYRQHGGAGRVRLAGAAGPLAQAAA